MSEDWEEKRFTGINLRWDYADCHSERTCRLSMNEYISDLLFLEGHKAPTKKQLYPYQYSEIVYGAKQQLAPENDTLPQLDESGIKHGKRIVGSLLYYTRAVDNKLLGALSVIGSQQAAETANMATAV